MEMRKIWRPLPVLAALIALLVGSFFIVNFTYLTNGGADVVAESAEFGPVYDARARERIRSEIDKAKETFAADMAADPQAREQGVTDYDTYRAWSERMTAGRDAPAIDAYRLASYQRINALELIQSQADIGADELRARLLDQACYVLHEAWDGYPCGALPATVSARIDALMAQYDSRSMLQYNVNLTLQDSGKWMLMTATLCAMILTSFPLTRDRQLHVTALQWSSRTGRRIRSLQMCAIGCSAALAGLFVGGLWAVWLGVRMRPILGFGIDSALYRDIAWFDGTVLQWLAANALTAGLAAAAFALLSAGIVGAQSNGIRMLLIAIPIAVASACCVNFVIGKYLYYLGNPLNRVLAVPGVEAIALTAMLALAIGLWLFIVHRLRRRELTD